MKKRTATALLATVAGASIIQGASIAQAKPMRESSEINKPVLTDVITSVEGRRQFYLRYGAGYFPFYGTVYQYTEETDPSPTTIIYGDDDSIYFKDLMDFGWESFIKGTISGSKITVRLPQTIFIENYEWAEEPYYNNLCVMTQEGKGENLSFNPDNDITEVTYTISETGEITLDSLPEGKALGVMTYFIGKVYDEEEGDTTGEEEEGSYHLEWLEFWSGAADFKQRFESLDVELIEMPEDAEILTYYCAVNGTNYPVEVAYKDDYMYIKGLSDNTYFSNLVVRATIDGDKAFIPQNQFVGIYSLENEMIITKCGYKNGRNIDFSPDEISFEFEIDDARNFIQVADPDMYLCFAYMRQYDPETKQNGLLTYFKDFIILRQESYAGVPSDPYGLFAHDDYLKGYGYYTFGFNLDAISTDHHILLTGDLYYRIFIDGELEIFEYDPTATPYFHYSKLPEPTTDIPYDFNNENDLQKTDYNEFEVGYYYEGVTTIGVQAIYKYGDEVTYSNLVTMNLETGETEVTAGVSTPKADFEVVKTEYFDLAGRHVENPGKGVYIEKSLMRDGTILSRKIIRRN